MTSPSASLTQPALRGRFGSLCSCSRLFRLSGFQQVQQNCLRNTGIRCKHKRSSSDNTEPILSAEERSSRQRSHKRQLKYQSLASYRSRFALALQAELNAEQEEIKKRLKNWPKQKLEEEGVALFDLYVQHEGSLYRDKLLKFSTRLGDGILPAHNQFGQVEVAANSRGHTGGDGAAS
ncbi:hypothetical protein L7F22_049646 [Adiantum nelumboides]|nr:hypothetical protein [Adiantum nelumboides]